MKDIIIIINGEEFIKLKLNEKLRLSEIRLFLLKNDKIRGFIGYPEHILIFLHKGSRVVDISKEDSKCLSDILSNNNELSIKTKKNNLEQISLKIGQNEKRLKHLPL